MVQITEPVAAPKTLEATLSYFLDTETMPVTLVGTPGGRDQRVGGGTTEQRHVVLRNGRLDADGFELERNGFRFVHHNTKVADFFDEDEVRRVYYPEMQALVKAETGAARVEVFDHTLRTDDEELRETPRSARSCGASTTTTPNGQVRSGCARFCRKRPTSSCSPLCGDPGVAADPSSGRDLATGDRRRAEHLARELGGDRATLSRPYRPDLCDHLRSGASLVLVSADAA